MPRGKFTESCSNYPPSFAQIKINKLTQKDKKNNKKEDKKLETEEETYFPPEDTGISDEELNCLLYRHAQLDQIQLLENIKEKKIDANSELEKYIKENLSRSETGRIIARLPKKENYRSMVSKNTITGAKRIKSIQRLLELQNEVSKAYIGMFESWVKDGVVLEKNG